MNGEWNEESPLYPMMLLLDSADYVVPFELESHPGCINGLVINGDDDFVVTFEEDTWWVTVGSVAGADYERVDGVTITEAADFVMWHYLCKINGTVSAYSWPDQPWDLENRFYLCESCNGAEIDGPAPVQAIPNGSYQCGMCSKDLV